MALAAHLQNEHIAFEQLGKETSIEGIENLRGFQNRVRAVNYNVLGGDICKQL